MDSIRRENVPESRGRLGPGRKRIENPRKGMRMNPEEKISRIPSFIREAVAEDLKTGRFDYVRTRLPPEPNGYLHIGHVKAFLIDYFTAKEFGGELYLRFDDTNPSKEETEFVDAIKEDAAWLGIEWVKETYASDYFDRLYDWAVRLVKMGLAYVDDQSQEEMSASRGTLPKGTKWSETESAIKPGVDSPYRNRSVAENLDLLERMKNGEFPEGSRVLRAKIDMSHPNILMRDPVMYRIMHIPHHRTTIVLMVFFSSRISPFTSTVIFCVRSPRATAVVTAAMLRTCAVRLPAIELTESVRSFQVPATPCTSACPPSLPSVPTSRATRVTSDANDPS